METRGLSPCFPMDITVKDFLNAGFYLDQDEDDADYYFDENTLGIVK